MWEAILYKIARLFSDPPSTEDRKLLDNISEMEKNGVRLIAKDNGGWKLEFDSPQAQLWYYRKATKGFENFKLKGE